MKEKILEELNKRLDEEYDILYELSPYDEETWVRDAVINELTSLIEFVENLKEVK